MQHQDILSHQARKCQYILQIQHVQSLLKGLQKYHDISYIQQCSGWVISMQQSMLNTQQIRKQINSLQIELQAVIDEQNNFIKQRNQYSAQIKTIQQEKMRQCKGFIEQLLEYGNKFSFQGIIEDFQQQFFINKKIAIENLLHFTNNYKSKNIHHHVQSKVQKIQEYYHKINLLFIPRVQIIMHCQSQIKKHLQKITQRREQLQRQMLSLKIDQQIQKNQYRRALAAHQEKLNDSENYIKIQAKNISLEYSNQKLQQNICRNPDLKDFQTLLLQQFMQRVDLHTKYCQQIAQLKNKIDNNSRQLFLLHQNQERCQQIRFNECQDQSLTIQEFQEKGQKDENENIQNINCNLVNYGRSNKKPSKKKSNSYEVYKKFCIGNGNDYNLQNYGNHHKRILVFDKDKLIFSKDHRLQKIFITQIQTVEFTKSNQLIFRLKKGFIVIYFPNKDAQLFTIQLKPYVILHHYI